MNRVLFIGMIVLLGACRSEGKLEQVLRYSGGNRAELEAVIEHYSQREEDSVPDDFIVGKGGVWKSKALFTGKIRWEGIEIIN